MRCLGRVFLLLFGLIFFLIGGGIAIFGTIAVRGEIARAERLTPVSAAAFDDLAPGSEVMIEGVLSQRNKARFRNFVAYRREEYRGSDKDGDPKWSVDEEYKPALLVETSGSITIAADRYSIQKPHQTWQEGRGLTWNGVTGEGTKRYSGFVAGLPVMAIGTVQPGSEGNELQANFVFGGSRTDYLADKRTTATFLPWFGGCFAMFGLLFIGIGVVVLIRGR